MQRLRSRGSEREKPLCSRKTITKRKEASIFEAILNHQLYRKERRTRNGDEKRDSSKSL